MISYHILPGLPATGPLPEQFSPDGRGAHREGFVVRVRPQGADAWVGNFQPGLTRFSDVVEHPHGRMLVVIAGGEVYYVDPYTRSLRAQFGGDVEGVLPLPELELLVLHNGLWFSALDEHGVVWESERISWDGLQNVAWDGEQIRAEAWDVIEDRWSPLTVNPRTGQVSGGVLSAPPR